MANLLGLSYPTGPAISTALRARTEGSQQHRRSVYPILGQSVPNGGAKHRFEVPFHSGQWDLKSGGQRLLRMTFLHMLRKEGLNYLDFSTCVL